MLKISLKGINIASIQIFYLKVPITTLSHMTHQGYAFLEIVLFEKFLC
jgi:hypothetical protein